MTHRRCMPVRHFQSQPMSRCWCRIVLIRARGCLSRGSVVVPMPGAEVITLAPVLDHRLLIDMAWTLLDESPFGPDVRMPIPRVVATLVNEAGARRRNDFVTLWRRRSADLDLNASCLSDACASEYA